MILVTNWYKLFYWLTRADSVKSLLDAFSNVFMLMFIIFGIFYLFLQLAPVSKNVDIGWETREGKKSWTVPFRWLWLTSMFFTFISWTAWALCPTKKEALLIMAGGGTMKFLASDSSAQKIPSEMTTFVVTELKSMAADAKVDLGLAQAKDKILQEAKNMTTTELVEKMKSDTNFAKIILNK